MKNWKSSGLMFTPLAIIIVVAATVLGTELLFMVLLHEFLVPMVKLSDLAWDVIDAATLAAVVAPLLYYLVCRKIQESEERLRQITAAAQDAIIVVNEQARVTEWNLAAQKMFQYSSEEALGQRLHQLIAPPRFHADAMRGFTRFQESGAGPLIGKTTEIAALRKDGSEFPIELSISALKLKGRWHAIGIIRDITERKGAEARLKLFRTLLDNSSDAIEVLDPVTLRFFDINETECRNLGYSREELLSMSASDIDTAFSADSRNMITAQLRQSGSARFEGVHRRKDGSTFPVEVNSKLIELDKPYVLSIARDITERKQTEMSLRNSENRLQTVIENLTEGIAVSDLDGQLLHFNRAALDLHGFTTLGECRQHLSKFADTFELSALDGTVWSLDQWPLARVLRGESLRDLEVRIRHIQAGWRRVFNYGGTLVRDAGGQPLMAVVTISDITERKQTETAFTTLVGTAAVNIGAAFFRETVRSLSAWLGVECVIIGELVDGNRVRALAMQLDGQAVEHYAYALPGTPCNQLASKGYCEYPEAVCQLFPADKDLSDMGAEAYIGTPIRDKNGKTIGVLCAISRHKIVPQTITKGVFEIIAARAGTEIERQRTEDKLQAMLRVASQSRLTMLSMIEDQKRTDEEVRQLNAELEEKVLARTADLERARHDAEEANQAKSKFLATMSHEIRTPMNGVIGMIDVLQQTSLRGPQIEMANIIHDSAFSLLAIIDDILDFSKIEAGKLQIDSVPMGIADVVEGACKTMDRMAEKKGVELTLFTDPAIPAEVLGDAGRLHQILINLTNNAIKFSSGPQRQSRVSVRAVLAESTPEQVTLEFRITDNGIGMDEATLARLFTVFTQADSSTTRIYGGTGLGLAISRQLANIMGGEITVHSEPGKGSVFSVRLPFKLPPDVGRAASTGSGQDSTRHDDGVGLKPEEHMGGHPPDLQNHDLVAGLPCLVVGNSESLADDLAAYLVHAGAMVERSPDIAAARQWIAVRPPGLYIVVLDSADSALATSLLDGLRTAARARPNLDVRFVAIGRGQRREPRLEGADLVAVDGNVLARRALLTAVAIAAGRAKQPDWEGLPGDVKATAKPLSREEARRQGSLILVAEDNEINQKVILQQLALLGKTADIANNGREALELWQSGDYAMLLADLHMPVMDGYELTAAIRAAETATSETNEVRIPIIAFTANVIKGEAEHCLAVGMDDYLSKPVQLVNLKAMLGKWLPVAAETAPVEINPDPLGRSRIVGASPDGTTSQSTKSASGQVAGYAREEKNNRTQGVLLQQPAPVSLPVDVNVLKKLVGDDEEIIRDFLHDFRLSAEKIAVELRTTCAAGQAADAGALAHKLKSSARSVGALALGELCAAMEQAGKAGDSEALTVLLPRFEQELAGVEGFLEGY